MTAANVSTKSVVKNIDDYLIRPLIESLYHFAMYWSDLEEAKRGDLDVVPMGSAALVAKELQSQRMMQAMQVTSNPVYGPMTEHRYLLNEYFKSLDIDTDKALVPRKNCMQTRLTEQEAQAVFSLSHHKDYQTLMAHLNRHREQLMGRLLASKDMPEIHQLQGRIKELDEINDLVKRSENYLGRQRE